ncbi:NADPH-dependent F420 reductase [Myxococcota bacterium]|nr:NADPH-dependent F420 reductase [Myxococcota bacterium]
MANTAYIFATMKYLNEQAIAILGGTGDQGLGLALRFAKAGRSVIVGSRKVEKAEASAKEVVSLVPGSTVYGFENSRAAQSAPIIFLSIPFESAATTVKAVRKELQPGQILVSMVVPLASSIGDSPVRTIGVRQGSAAELVKSLVPKGVKVVSALQNVSAQGLQSLDEDVQCDVVISGPKDGREEVAKLCALIPGLRAVNGGDLSNARVVEDLTGLLIGLNIRYRMPKGIGIRFPGLPE